MLRFLYKLSKVCRAHKLGAGWYPLPSYIRRYLAQLPKSRQLAIVAKLMKGNDLSFLVPGEVGCCEAVTRVIHEVLPDFEIITGTATLNRILSRDYRFRLIQNGEAIQPGDIIISPTGYGDAKSMPHGHTGIFVEDKRIYSNDSASEKWVQNYTLQSWTARYKLDGKYPINIFRIV